MFAIRARCAAAALLIVATAGCAGQSGPPRTGGAAPPKFETPSAASASPKQAFVDGYRAYRSGDFARAQVDLIIAAAGYPQLGDYALFYLGMAQRATGDRDGSESTLRKMLRDYPQSVFADRAQLEVARIALDGNRYGDAESLASELLARTSDPEIEQAAELVNARAMIESGRPRDAYAQLQTLRRDHPRGAADADARALAQSLLAAHPELADVHTVEYWRAEAELLLSEGQSATALEQIEAALTLSPSRSVHAELLWLKARALRSDPAREEEALNDYLVLAPRGLSAAPALDRLARVYWQENNTARAGKYFGRLATQFPASTLAPDAMLDRGRAFEDDGDWASARNQYERLLARYPASEAAIEGRFRAAWALYMTEHYAGAAASFGAAARAAHPRDRDMLLYWQARALEKAGHGEPARTIFERVALSVDTNYYPALAARRAAVTAPPIPAALARDPSADPPEAVPPNADFHFSRVIALKTLGLRELEPAELRWLRGTARFDPALASFVLGEFQEVGAYNDAIWMAETMAALGEIRSDVAERVRYPRAYWDLIEPAARQTGLDPYLLLALTRQESKFDPNARSGSDARGLMQLLPSTAHRVAADRGADPVNVDLYDAALNVELGTSYLGSLMKMFDGDQFKAIAAYNGGEHAVERWTRKFPGDDDEWVENIGYHETRDYVKKVIGGRREYQLIYQPASNASGSIPQPRSPE